MSRIFILLTHRRKHMITFIELLPYIKAFSFILLYLYVFWTCFLACAALYGQWKTLPIPVKILAAPIALAGIVIDVVWEFTGACIMFMDLPPPNCITFTQRLSYYLKESGWRNKVANMICTYLLNPFQVGSHCH
jgi:hypothetical protein